MFGMFGQPFGQSMAPMYGEGMLGTIGRALPGSWMSPLAQYAQVLGSLPPQASQLTLSPEQGEELIGSMIGLGITKGAGKFAQAALERMAKGAEQVTMEGGARALNEAVKNVQLYPQTVLQHATNPLRRTPEQMAELTKSIQARGVDPGSVLMWRMPGGGLKLVEGHHTATAADLLDPRRKIPVSVMDAPLGQTLFR